MSALTKDYCANEQSLVDVGDQWCVCTLQMHACCVGNRVLRSSVQIMQTTLDGLLCSFDRFFVQLKKYFDSIYFIIFYHFEKQMSTFTLHLCRYCVV